MSRNNFVILFYFEKTNSIKFTTISFYFLKNWAFGKKQVEVIKLANLLFFLGLANEYPRGTL
jgi:hypothetical protein